MSDLILQYLAAGLGVGFLVGLTGVGGGSLMTPLLVFMFGHPPGLAVGTDLLFAAGTKATGTLVHHKRSSVDWGIVRLMCWGSIPAALITLLVLWATQAAASKNGIVLALLGSLVILTGLQTAGLRLPWLQRAITRLAGGNGMAADQELGVQKPWLTVAGGAVLGVLVTLTSIGAGVLGTVMLRTLYPRLQAKTLVGVDLAHAIPLTLIAGSGYLLLGNIDFQALAWLLVGSTPGVIAGSLLSHRLNEQALRRAIGVLLLVIGSKTLMAAM